MESDVFTAVDKILPLKVIYEVQNYWNPNTWFRLIVPKRNIFYQSYAEDGQICPEDGSGPAACRPKPLIEIEDLNTKQYITI